MSIKIGIIGAGIAGLTAAYYLQKYGYSVTLYEASNRAGGRIITERVQNYMIDGGAQFLSADYPTLIPFIDELGLTPELVEISPWFGIVRNKKLYGLSSENFFSPLLTGYLKLSESLQFALALRRWHPKFKKLSLSNYTEWTHFDDESAEEFMQREFPETILEYFIEPLLQAYYFQAPNEVSKIQALMLFNFVMRRGKLLNFKNGIDTLIHKLSEFLDIKLDCKIDAINISANDSIMLHSKSQEFFADYLILATTASVARKLLKNPSELENNLLNTAYSSTINLCLAMHSHWSPPKNLNKLYGVAIPRKERQHIAAFTLESNKNNNRVSEGELLHIMLNGSSGSELIKKSDGEILELATAELGQYLPGIASAIKFSHIIRWKEAEPILAVGKSQLIQEYRANLTSKNRVFLVGDYLGFPYTDGAAFTGKWTADFIKHIKS